jgi:DNA-binding winged helix-turn-helix (wHTH) protein
MKGLPAGQQAAVPLLSACMRKFKPQPRFLQTFYNFAITLSPLNRSIDLALSFRLQGEKWMEPVQMNSINQLASYQDGHLRIDFARQTVALDSQLLVLTRKEYELLSLFVEHAGEIVPRETLLMRVWGYSTEIRTRTLDVHIRRLRRKLGVYAGQYIETIFGIGYRFQPYRAKRILQAPVEQTAIALGA